MADTRIEYESAAVVAACHEVITLLAARGRRRRSGGSKIAFPDENVLSCHPLISAAFGFGVPIIDNVRIWLTGEMFNRSQLT